MNIHPMQMALAALEDSILTTIEECHRCELITMAHKLRIILRAHGVFMPGGFVPTIQQRAVCIRRDQASLKAVIESLFPLNSPVYVDSPRYRGCGLVTNRSNEVYPDQLAVMLENRNTWWYPIEHCKPIEWKDCDRSIRLIRLENGGICSCQTTMMTRNPVRLP